MKRQVTRLIVWSIQWFCFQLMTSVILNIDFKVTELILMPSTYCVHLTRDLFAIAKFLYVLLLYFTWTIS